MDPENPMNIEEKVDSDSETSSAPQSESKRILNEILERSREASMRIAREVKDQSRSVLVAQKNQLSDGLEGLASSLFDTADKMRERQQGAAAIAAETGAEKIRSLSSNLREKGPEELFREIEYFARSRPAAFLGLALASGFLLGQLISGSLGPKGEIVGQRSESSIEYQPDESEEGYYERH